MKSEKENYQSIKSESINEKVKEKQKTETKTSKRFYESEKISK